MSSHHTQSKLSQDFRTTVPRAVRLALNLSRGDHLKYAIYPDSKVVLTRLVEENEADPVLGRFLVFLAQDMAHHPERLMGMSQEVRDRVAASVDKIEVNLNERLHPEDE